MNRANTEDHYGGCIIHGLLAANRDKNFNGVHVQLTKQLHLAGGFTKSICDFHESGGGAMDRI